MIYVVSDGTGKTARKSGKLHLAAGVVRVQVASEWRKKGVGRFLGLFGFLFINMCMGRDKAFWDADRMRGELGPRPPNAKGDLPTLRKQYLGE